MPSCFNWYLLKAPPTGTLWAPTDSPISDKRLVKVSVAGFTSGSIQRQVGQARRSESRWSGIRAKLVVAYPAQGIHKSAQLWGVGIYQTKRVSRVDQSLVPS